MERVRRQVEDDNEYVWYQRRYVWLLALIAIIIVLFLFRTATSGDSHNVFQDVHIEDCRLVDNGQLEATGEAFNHGSGTKDYDIRVRFIVNSINVGENTTTVHHLRSDHGASWRVRVNSAASGAMQCEIISINRH